MRRITRRRGACQACRSRKVRCDGADPCLNCERNGQACYYPPLAPRPRRNTTHGTGTNGQASHNIRINTDQNAPPYEAWQQFSGENALLTPNSTEDRGINGANSGMNGDDMRCMLELSLPDSFPGSQHDGELGLLDLPMPGEDELMELLEATPSECNSTGGFNFNFSTSHVDNLVQSPTSVQPTSTRDQWQRKQKTASPPDYDTLFNFNEAAEPVWNDSNKPGKPADMNDVTVVVDFAAANLYGLPNFLSRTNREPQRTETTKIVNGLRRVLCGGPSAAASKDAMDLQKAFPESDAALSRYCDACFEDCCPLARFLTRPAVEKIIRQSRESEADQLVTAFAEAILAVGYYTSCLRSVDAPRADEIRDSQRRLSSALRLYSKIQNCPSSLTKFQAILVMAVIACMCDESRIWDKITASVCCARELRLVHAARGQQSDLSEQDQMLAQRSVWFLYSLETDYAIHHGMLPILDLGWGSQFPSFEQGDDMIAVFYTHSELLHSVLKFQYSPRALNKSASAYDRRDRLQASCHVLNEWVSSLPTPLNEAYEAKTLQDIRDSRQLRKAFRVFCMYHQAVFFIHCPWVSPISSDDAGLSGIAEQTRERCIERCLESAFAVVKLANSGLFWEKGLERDISSSSSRWGDMGQLLLVSLCFIVYYLVNGEKASRKTAMPYLAICGGLFGRLSLDSDEASLLDHYLELVQMVRAN
ncbi:hypothetical protein CH35J_012120 [Colletotrichum higginsianum]|uniref:Zn(2)-C6 fungal-type domain-containing protein n=1 Tax=Colletotrichum higginsianum TaxID=80884 RepID=A0A4T0VEN4_9PEZI|nr:hypothetical protein CH35J_012120 [Colletotrichum higginsianum]